MVGGTKRLAQCTFQCFGQHSVNSNALDAMVRSSRIQGEVAFEQTHAYRQSDRKPFLCKVSVSLSVTVMAEQHQLSEQGFLCCAFS